MAPPYQISDWYGGRPTCHTASGATAVGDPMAFPIVKMENKKPPKTSPFGWTTLTPIQCSSASAHRKHHLKPQLRRLRHRRTRTPYNPHWIQWRGPNLSPKVSLAVDRLPNPSMCIIPGPARRMMRNGIRIRSAVFPRCTEQTDRPTERSRESSMTIVRSAQRATRPNNVSLCS